MSIQQENFKAIADKIRKNTNATEAIKPSAFANKVDEVYTAGKQAEYDAFWDIFQQSGTLLNYNHAFYRWFKENYKPKYPIRTVIITNGFAYSKIEDTLVDIEILESYQNTTLSQLFNQCTVLHTVRSLVFPRKITTYTNCFAGCKALTNLTVSGCINGNGFNVSDCPLTKDSLLSVLETLADKTADTNTTEWVCTLGTANLEKLSATEIAVATEKGWSLA